MLNKLHNTTSIILRLEHVIGPNESVNKFNGWVLDKLRSNVHSIDLTKGEQIRDFIFVNDILSAINLLIEKRDLFLGKITLIEIGCGKGYSIRHFIRLLQKKIKSNTVLNFGALDYKKDDLMSSVANNNVLLKLGWNPITDLNEIIDYII